MVSSKHRPVALALFVAVFSALLFATAAHAAPPEPTSTTPTNPIVARAFEDLGTWQGQCWTFMKKVVSEAIGAEVGFDYRDGYLEAGAHEVSLAAALPGDIIQLVDDSNHGPDADYLGLHTAIIYEVLGGGRFNVIDSNANWDGMVTTREYDPRAAAARYWNISVHVYRFGEVAPGDEVIPGTPTTPSPALTTGDTATVNTPGECLNLRAGAGTEYDDITCLADRTQVQITSDVVVVAGRRWVSVTAGSVSGWVAADYLQRAPVLGSGVGNTNPTQPQQQQPTPTVTPEPTQPFRLFVPLLGSDN